MTPTRRRFLTASAMAAASPLFARAVAGPAFAQAANPPAAPDPRMAPRQDGSPAAKDRVEEWFSFTCPHCAAFALEVYPDVKAKLIDTGKLLYVFREFPRDKLDLMAAMVARSLPP